MRKLIAIVMLHACSTPSGVDDSAGEESKGLSAATLTEHDIDQILKAFPPPDLFPPGPTDNGVCLDADCYPFRAIYPQPLPGPGVEENPNADAPCYTSSMCGGTGYCPVGIMTVHDIVTIGFDYCKNQLHLPSGSDVLLYCIVQYAVSTRLHCQGFTGTDPGNGGEP